MITPDYARVMARYNRWQNTQLADFFAALPQDAITLDRGAFFGSILGTANHLLWADTLWMSRLAGTPPPETPADENTTMTRDAAAWTGARAGRDKAIEDWADALAPGDLDGDLTWHSGLMGKEVSKPRSLCVAQLFNHQTHHRGQIHAMLTAVTGKGPISDLAFMPEEP